MRKGLTTLMTVAIALVSVQGLAYAPLIGQIPSPIVGNKSGTPTQATAYVYPDAFDLHMLATDDYTTSNALMWSYELVAPAKYAINGQQVINSVSGNVVNPPAANQISGPLAVMNSITGANDPNTDGKINTVTIRNIALYPYGGTPSTDQSASAQNWATHMQPVTFWCSDGNLASSSTVMFYTDNTYNGVPIGYNRLSNASAWTKIRENQFLNASTTWAEYDPFFDHLTSKTWTDGKGICLEVTATGQNWGSVSSQMGWVPLTDNMVYRIRAKMNCSQLTPGKTPFWDFILENWNGDGSKGLNLYGMDNFYLDNEGGASAIVNKSAGTEIQMIWAPAAFQTTQWRNTSTGIFAANAAPPAGNGVNYLTRKDAQLRFRVLDVDSNAALLNNQKSGSICLQNVIVETCPFNQRVYTTGSTATPATANLYNVTVPKAAHANPLDLVPGNMIATPLVGTTIAYSTGSAGLQLTPTGTGQTVEIVTVTPATDLLYTEGTWATIADNWPIPWQSNKIYELEVKLSAPDATNQDHPWDVLWLNMEPPTNEVIAESYVTANTGLAMPKQGTPQSYYQYYYSCYETQSAVSAFHFLRWRIRFGNNGALNWPTPANTTNTGMVRIHSVKVNQVEFR